MRAANVSMFECRDGVKLAYAVFSGAAGRTPVVMINGLSGVKEEWGSLTLLLARDRAVATLDNRGVGASYPSSRRHPSHSWSDFADSILDLLNHLQWPRAILLGHSMGVDILFFSQ